MQQQTPRAPRSWRRGLQGRLLILTGAGMLASYLAAGVVSEVAIARSERRAAQERQLAAAAIAAHLDAEIVAALATLQQVALDPRVVLTPDNGETRAALRAAHRRIGWVGMVFLADRDGRVLLADPAMPAEPLSPALATHVVTALQSLRPTVSDLVPSPPGRGAVYLLVPSWHPGQPPSLAIGAIAEPESRAFGHLLAPMRRARPGGFMVVDGAGGEIANEAGASLDRDETSEAVLGAARWRVRVAPAVPASPAGPARRTVAALAAVVFAAMLLLAWGAARSLGSPIAVLTAATERIAGGEMDAPLPPASDDEVGRLSASFDRMRRTLQESLQEIATANRTLEQRVEARTTELTRLYAELQARERQRAALLAKIIGTQEEERKRVAREIHEESCQLLVALDLRLSALADVSPGDTREALVGARALAAQTQDALRRLMHDLRPAVLDDVGLMAAIRSCADRHLGAAAVKVRLELPTHFPRLPHDIETALFRAVQEVIINIARHARADRALVQVRHEAGVGVVIEIEDDGEGFDPASLKPSPDGRGLGLVGLRERIDLVGGVTEIESAPGAGTRVVLRVPVSAAMMEDTCPAFGS